jgi:tetratricopeptide (TPR) repeat protein
MQMRRTGATYSEQAMINDRKSSTAIILLLAGGLSLGGSLAFAASGGGSTSGGASTPDCSKGYVWSTQKSKCVKATSSNMDDKTLYSQGRDLALAGRYQEALDALDAVKNQDSMVLTMIGYSKRKMGNYDEGLVYYQKALVLDPNNVDTHEYLGEAYAEKGKLDLAKAELVKVASVCGTTCEQYQDLANAIAGIPDES